MKKRILINRNFMYLWVGKVISLLGDKFYGIALAWWILQKTNSPKIMGFFLLVSVLPGLVIGFYAGAVADRCNRKNVLVITDILRGLLVFAIVALSVTHSLMVWQVFVIGAVLSSITAFFDPAVQAVIPQVVGKEELPKANSMNQMVSGICTILGPALGAAAISLFGVSAVFFFNGLSFIISAIFEKLVRLETSSAVGNEARPIYDDLKEGLQFLKCNKSIIRIIIIIAVAHFFMGCLMVALPFLANGLSGSGVQNLGYLETMLGAGLLLGAIYISRKKSQIMKEQNLIYLIFLIGISFLVISTLLFLTLKAVIPYMLTFMMIGSIISGASVFWQSLLQLKTPGHMTGRVFSISTLAANISMPIAYAVFGVLLTYSPLYLLMLFCGGFLILFAWTLQLRRHRL